MTLNSRCQSPIDGDSPATCASVAQRAAVPRDERREFRDRVRVGHVQPHGDGVDAVFPQRRFPLAFFPADWPASTTRCDWPRRRAVDMPIPPPPITSATGSPGRSSVPVCTVTLSSLCHRELPYATANSAVPSITTDPSSLPEPDGQFHP